MKIKIEKIFEKRNITKEELAEKTGLKMDLIEKLIDGSLSKIEVEVLEKLCATLDCQTDDIIVNE